MIINEIIKKEEIDESKTYIEINFKTNDDEIIKINTKLDNIINNWVFGKTLLNSNLQQFANRLCIAATEMYKIKESGKLSIDVFIGNIFIHIKTKYTADNIFRHFDDIQYTAIDLIDYN